MTTAREETCRLADLLRSEHHALAVFLLALATFDQERRWVELGYSSLFYFLTRELGLSKGAAYYRKTAAELVQRYPEILEALREGKLCLTSIVELSKVIAPENRAEVLPRYFHLSKREAKEVTAEILPVAAPPLRTVVTSLPAEDGPPLPLAASFVPAVEAARASVPVHPANLVHANATIPGGVHAPSSSRPQPPKVEPLTADLSRIHVTVSRRLLAKLAAAKDALSHSHPGASEETIIEVGLDLINERHARRRGLVKNPRKRAPAPAESSPPMKEPADPAKDPGRYVAAEVRRAIWVRDQGKCQWPIEGGGICGATCRAELDHASKPFAKGGRIIKPEDGRVLCDFHQDVSARKEFGDDLMNRYTRPKGPTCSEPVAVYGPQLASASSVVSSGRGLAGRRRRPSGRPRGARRGARSTGAPRRGPPGRVRRGRGPSAARPGSAAPARTAARARAATAGRPPAHRS